MALRIVCRTADKGNIIELHGWLSGPEIADFLAVCGRTALPLSIDLASLSGTSADGLLALREQRARGARLVGASPFIELMLRGQRDKGGGTGGP